MTTIPEVARLHESTVQNAEALIARHRRRKQAPPVPGLRHVRVHERVWETAMDLADGDWHRIQVVSATEVLVTNG